jgi:hypothetical protein
MSRTTGSALVSSLLLLCGCEMEPPPGAPRAPLPSEIKATPNVQAPTKFQPKSMLEVRKELAAKKAKQEAEEAAAKQSGAGASGAPDSATTKSVDPKSTTPKAGETAPPTP